MPVMTLAEAAAHVTSTDPRFALGRATVRGVDLPIFVNAPNALRDVMQVGEAARADLPDGGDYIIYEGERMTYAAWVAETNRIAHALVRDIGVKPGDRVAIAMRNYPEYLSLMMAIAAVGGVVVLVNAWWTPDELRYGFEDSGARIVFADGPRAANLVPFAAELGLRVIGVRDGVGETHYDTLLAGSTDTSYPTVPIDTDDDFAVMYSSGSTGHPKGVVLTHRGAIAALYSWFMGFSLMPLMVEEMPPPTAARQTLLITTPFFHITATHPCFLLSIPLGAKIVLMRKWDADLAVDLVEREEVTRFLAVPTMSADLTDAAVRQGRTLKTLSNLSAGGAKRPAAQVLEQDKALPHVVIASGYGMTESNALGLGISGPEYAAKPDSAGRLYPPLQELKIADDDGNALPNGQIGEICLKSVTAMRCYLNKPEATAEALRDGWLHTGDLGRLDDDGYVEIVDRKKNIIIRGGENISCLEVEGAIHKHPAVAEAAVFAIPDERLNETVGAAVQLRPGATLKDEELTAHLSSLLAKFKWPEKIWWTDQVLIRGATDKTDRRAIRTACLEGRL